MSRPILFLCSKNLTVSEISSLKNTGRVLNLNEQNEKEELTAYLTKDYIIVNVLSPDQVEKLKYFNMDSVMKVLYLRRYEGTTEGWTKTLVGDYVIKHFGILTKAKTKEELLNLLKLASQFKKKPDTHIMFYIKKFFKILNFLAREKAN